MGSVAARVGARSLRTGLRAALAITVCLVAPAALGADCPGHPNALGTSRTLVVDPREHPRIGTMQYPETLPLADHEVVLTFDDGPLPRYSNQVLEILASQCVKAIFFTIGHQAQESPEGVRKLRDAGHTIGTHTQNHPLSMNHMTIDRAKQEIDEGIASVKAALGEDADKSLAPFFRIPGLLRANNVEDYLAEQGIQVWSTDFLADDWHHISPARVYELAMKRLEAKGKGILLLHDIHARTVAALPRFLNELKARGYHIVGVVPATADRPATPTEPQQWRTHPAPETMGTARWPDVPNFVVAETSVLPVPALPDLGLLGEQPLASAKPTDRANALNTEGSPAGSSWPRVSESPPENGAASLPTPAPGVFEVPEGLRVAENDRTLSHHRERTPTEAQQAGAKPASIDLNRSKRLAHRRVQIARVHAAHGSPRDHRHRTPKVAGRAAPPSATAHRGPQAKKRNV
jgi:peptidoglycan-N-acetylglucosamine deacetylase